MRSDSKRHFRPTKRSVGARRSTEHFQLIKGSFSPRKVTRQSPLLGSIHRVVDGATLGVLVAVAMMSALTLHWQHLWTVAFTRLESTRNLSHRLTESTALIEKHMLQKTSLPERLVQTKAANLIYLTKSDINSRLRGYSSSNELFARELSSFPLTHGY